MPDTRLPRRPGLPIRGSAVLVLVAACAILFLLSRGPDGGPGPSMLLALALLYAAASALPRSRWLQSGKLNPGRSGDESRRPLQLLRLASGLVLALWWGSMRNMAIGPFCPRRPIVSPKRFQQKGP